MPVLDNGTVVRHVVPPPAPVVTPLLAADPQFLLPGTYDISIYRGDTYEWWFSLKALDPALGSLAPVNITGWRFKAEIRASPDSPLLASMQEMARDDAAGTVAMRLTHDQSRLVTGSGVWDLEGIMPDGWVRTCLRGRVSLVTDVTTGRVDYMVGYGRH